jgi:hypothetical protein
LEAVAVAAGRGPVHVASVDAYGRRAKKALALRGLLGLYAVLVDLGYYADLLEYARKALVQIGVAGAAIEVEQFYLHDSAGDGCGR